MEPPLFYPELIVINFGVQLTVTGSIQCHFHFITIKNQACFHKYEPFVISEHLSNFMFFNGPHPLYPSSWPTVRLENPPTVGKINVSPYRNSRYNLAKLKHLSVPVQLGKEEMRMTKVLEMFTKSLCKACRSYHLYHTWSAQEFTHCREEWPLQYRTEESVTCRSEQ